MNKATKLISFLLAMIMTFTATQTLAYASVSAPQNLTVDASDG